MNTDDRNRALWYRHPNVRFEIVKALRYGPGKIKEMQIIGEGLSIRWLNVQHVALWDKVRHYLNIEKRAASIYASLDTYKMIPMMSFNLRKRQEEYNAWADGRGAQIAGPDFGLDLDVKLGTYKDAIPDNQKIRSLFDAFGVRYANWMSGEHGFHFVVPHEDMPDDVKALPYLQQIAFYKQIASHIAKKCRSVDLSIYMPTRVLKCPYTLEKGGRVIWPLDERSWALLRSDNLSLHPVDILEKFLIRDRGVYLQGTPDGINKFIKKWSGWL